MSSNTNTLFWVIAGAVVILGVFLLTNNSSDNTVNTIANRFDGIYNEQLSKSNEKDSISKEESKDNNLEEENVPSTEEVIPEKTQEEIDLEEYMKQSTRYYCRPPVSTDNRLKFKMVYANDNRIAYNVTNISDEDLVEPWIMLVAYNCNTGKAVKHCALSLNEFKAGQSGTYICSGGSLGADYEYYAVFSTEFY